MAFNPFLDMRDVFLGVLEIVVHVALVAVEEVNLRRFAGLDRHRPGSVLDASCDVAWECICFGRGEVHVFGAGFGVEIVEWVLGLLV